MNIAFSSIITLWAGATALMAFSMSLASGEVPAAAAGQSTPNPYSFMGDPALIRFYIIDMATGLPLNIIMFASGIGLINARRWGAWWWTRAAWAKIVRLIAVYGYFIVAVVPPLSAGMTRMVMAMLEAQKLPPGKGLKPEELTKLYIFSYSFMSVAMIVLGMIYPAVSIWILGRPGVKAALSGDDGEAERETSLP
ncbi:hypothetical protein TA3x_003279 [Tundrisphaera sp. TA3]|uniref:hypothetical protein n=1 Tax=Tundrisphaera sp. TA3 TaxID=3435775 RepID=UPI003EBB6227